MTIVDDNDPECLSFQEALTVVGALRDYGALRRSHGQEEDAVMVYAYTKIKNQLTDAGKIDREAFERAMEAVFVPNILNQETEDDT